jgi:hypothetical protein
MGIVSDANSTINELFVNYKDEYNGANIFKKIIISLKYKKYINRLTQMMDKINKADVPVTRDDLIELASLIYNSNPTDPSFDAIRDIKYIKSNDMQLYILMIHLNDTYNCMIRLDCQECAFNVKAFKVFENSESEEFDMYSYNGVLETKNSDQKEIIDKLNKVLWGVIKRYLLSVIDNMRENYYHVKLSKKKRI